MYLLLYDSARFYVLNYLTLLFPALLGLINSRRPAIHHCPLGSCHRVMSKPFEKLVVNVNTTSQCVSTFPFFFSF